MVSGPQSFWPIAHEAKSHIECVPCLSVTRVQGHGALERGDPLAKLVLPFIDEGGGERHLTGTGHQFRRSREFEQGAIVVLIPIEITVGDRQPRLAQVWTTTQRLLRLRLRLRFARKVLSLSKTTNRNRESGASQSKIWIEIECLLIKVDRCFAIRVPSPETSL